MRILFFLFSFSSCGAFMLALYALFQPFSPRRHREVIHWVFAVLSLLLSAGCFGSAFFISSPNPETAALWFKYFSATWYFSPGLMTLIAFLLTERRINPLSLGVSLLPGLALTITSFLSPSELFGTVIPIASGYRSSYNMHSLWNLVNVLNYTLLPLFAITLLVKELFVPDSSQSGQLRKARCRTVLIYLLITFGSTLLSGFVLRFFGLEPLPPLLPLFMSVLLVGFFLALFHDEILELAPSTTLTPILSSLFDAVVIAGPTGMIIDTNLGGDHHQGGLAAKDLHGASVSLLIPEIEQPEEWLVRHATHQEREFEARFSFEPGQLRTASLSVQSVADDGGRCIGYTITAHDLSAEKKLEAEIQRRMTASTALKTLEKRFSTAFKASPAGMAIVEQESWQILDMNEAAARLLGYPHEGVKGRRFRDINVRVEGEEIQSIVERLRRDEPSPSKEVHVVRPDGTKAICLVAASPLIIDGKRTAVFSVVDISELEVLRAELSKAQKLESIGVLAGGLAHDFNNILTAVLGNVSLARMSMDEDAEAAEALSAAEAACLRAKDLSSQLLTFARGGEPTHASTEILPLTREAVRMAVAGTSVMANFSSTDNLPPILADSGQILQVFSNIAINAVQAMDGKGILTVRVSLARISGETSGKPPVMFGELASGEYVCVEFEDSGPGIPAEMISRIFDPYVTTKKSGSGLGLAICYSVIKRHRGSIQVFSDPGKGSRFAVYLPAIRAALEEKKKNPVSFGKGTVLLMDDDFAIRKATSRMLERLGYEATVCPEGSSAVAAFKSAMSSGKRFNAVILDLTVPGGMGGVDAASLIRSLDPAVPIFVSSGYSDTPVLADFAAYGFDGVLSKPYGMEDLSRRLSGE